MALADLPFLQSVDERDVDFVLLEEFHSDPAFVRWFFEKVTGKPYNNGRFVGAWHSISDPCLGESDLTVVIESNDKRFGVLIENKIDALAQPEQAGRYSLRATNSKIAGEWHECATCIVAPERYLAVDQEAGKYDARITYEAIHDWLRRNTPETKRRQFRLDIFAMAIKQHRRGRTRHVDERVAMFFREYWSFAEANFAELRMRRHTEAAANNTWADFRPEQLRKRYPHTYLYHKIDKGSVDIHFEGLREHLPRLQEANRNILIEGVELVARGRKTVALTVGVQPMKPTEPFTNQTELARIALKAAYRLNVLLPLFIRL